ncbi:hypothetical protein [Nocardia puris]|uniref:2'-5' RNA ligase n=1 Tax=Nocardia puris TaxID=208602 RepID=A0A366DMS8_9NOCA|nr:hypothetical protein [Nocardia puris]RBO91356.1 hypothetical protein DFR74_10458 [Nocardia puris]
MYGQKFQFGSSVWPQGRGVVQVYALVDLDKHIELAELLRAARQAMDGAPVVAVRDEHVHVTIDVVAGVTADRIPNSERAELAVAISDALADVPIFRGTVGPTVAGGTGAKMYISPASPLVLVQDQVRKAIRTLRGDAASTWTQPRPHLTTHFCTAPDGEIVDSDPWNRRLYKAADSLLAPIEIAYVQLVDVRADNATKAFSWTPVSDPIPLGRERG